MSGSTLEFLKIEPGRETRRLESSFATVQRPVSEHARDALVHQLRGEWLSPDETRPESVLPLLWEPLKVAHHGLRKTRRDLGAALERARRGALIGGASA